MGELSRNNESHRIAADFYASIHEVRSPYFQSNIIFNSDGFNHLQFSAGRERNKKEQLLKFLFLKHVPYIVKNSGTLQEHRKTMQVGERRRYAKGERDMELVEYWGFIAIVPNTNSTRIKVILRKVGKGAIHFWSVMPTQKKGTNNRILVGSGDMLEG